MRYFFGLLLIAALVLVGCAGPEPASLPSTDAPVPDIATPVPTEINTPTDTPLPTSTSTPEPTATATLTPMPALSEEDLDALATAWRVAVFNREHLNTVIKQVETDNLPSGLGMMTVKLPATIGINTLKEKTFPEDWQELCDGLFANLEGVIDALDNAGDADDIAGELREIQSNLDSIQAEIMPVLPPEVLTPAPTNTPRPAQKGDRSMPVPPGEAFAFEYNNAQLALVLEETLRGKPAEELRNVGQTYILRVPREGLEFYMARFTVAYLEGDADNLVRVDTGDFGIEADNKLYGHTIGTWEGVLDVRMFPGAEETGWVLFQVPIGAEVQHIRYRPFLSDSEIWFAVPE